MVNEDVSTQKAMNLQKIVIWCPFCNITGCTKIVCPLQTQKINGLTVKCYQSDHGCNWTGLLSNLSQHSLKKCINTKKNCLVK